MQTNYAVRAQTKTWGEQRISSTHCKWCKYVHLTFSVPEMLSKVVSELNSISLVRLTTENKSSRSRAGYWKCSSMYFIILIYLFLSHPWMFPTTMKHSIRSPHTQILTLYYSTNRVSTNYIQWLKHTSATLNLTPAYQHTAVYVLIFTQILGYRIAESCNATALRARQQ